MQYAYFIGQLDSISELLDSISELLDNTISEQWFDTLAVLVLTVPKEKNT